MMPDVSETLVDRMIRTIVDEVGFHVQRAAEKYPTAIREAEARMRRVRRAEARMRRVRRAEARMRRVRRLLPAAASEVW